MKNPLNSSETITIKERVSFLLFFFGEWKKDFGKNFWIFHDWDKYLPGRVVWNMKQFNIFHHENVQRKSVKSLIRRKMFLSVFKDIARISICPAQKEKPHAKNMKIWKISCSSRGLKWWKHSSLSPNICRMKKVSVMSWHRHDEIFHIFLDFFVAFEKGRGMKRSVKDPNNVDILSVGWVWWTEFLACFMTFRRISTTTMTSRRREKMKKKKGKLFSEAWASVFEWKWHDHVWSI